MWCLLRNTVTQMVYKHAISTIVPGRAVNFHAANEGASLPQADCPAHAPVVLALKSQNSCRIERLIPPIPPTARAVLVGVDFGPRILMVSWRSWAAGADRRAHPVARLTCKRKAPDAALFVGSGKADEIKAGRAARGAGNLV
jgi:hypothetical protein